MFTFLKVPCRTKNALWYFHKESRYGTQKCLPDVLGMYCNKKMVKCMHICTPFVKLMYIWNCLPIGVNLFFKFSLEIHTYCILIVLHTNNCTNLFENIFHFISEVGGGLGTYKINTYVHSFNILSLSSLLGAKGSVSTLGFVWQNLYFNSYE